MTGNPSSRSGDRLSQFKQTSLLPLLPLLPLLVLPSALGLTAACSETVIEIEIDARSTIAGLTQLDVVVSNDGDSIKETFDVDGLTFPLTFTVTAGGRSGVVQITVEGKTASGDVRAVAVANTSISSGNAITLKAKLEPADFVVNNTAQGIQRQAFLVDRNGRGIATTPSGFAVTFVNDCSVAATCDVFIRHFDNDGSSLELNGSNADLAVNGTDYSIVSVPAIAVNDAGEMAITWETNDTVYVSVIRSDGSAVIRDAAVSPSDVDDPVDPAVVAVGSNFYLVWHQNGGNPSVPGLHQRSLAGSNLTAISQVDPGIPRSAAAVATNGSQILLVWSRNGVLVSQLGSSSGPPLEVVSFSGELIGAPTIKPVGTGYVVAYGRSKAGQSGGFMLSLLNDSGQLVRNVTLLEKGRAATDSPAVAVDASGNIAAVWSQCAEQPEGSVDGSGCAVMIALFDSSLAPLSEPRVVNTTTMGDQFEPSITAVANGFAVAWSDSSGIGDSDGGIRARVIYADTF